MPACSRCGRARRNGWARMMSDWLGMRVEVVEFAGAWLPLPPDQRTRLSSHGPGAGSASMPRPACGPGTRRPGSYCASDRSTCRVPAAAAGSRRAAPAGVAGARLCRVRDGLRHQSGPGRPSGSAAAAGRPGGSAAAAGLEYLGAGAGRRLHRRADAADAVFEAEVIEAQRVDWRKPETVGNAEAVA